jgi:hypothetical protein
MGIMKILPRSRSSSSITVRLSPHTGWTPQSIRPPSASRLLKDLWLSYVVRIALILDNTVRMYLNLSRNDGQLKILVHTRIPERCGSGD